MSDLAKARRLLARTGAWIDVGPDGYGLRIGANRRARVLLTLDEATFRALIAQPGLRVRPGGGWVARTNPESQKDAAPEPGRPGVIEGIVSIPDGDGRLRSLRANLGQSPVAWLAGRKDEDGRPWLSPAHVAAAGRLAMDVEAALRGPSLTMRWDALPRSGGSATRSEPGDPAMAAGRRVEAALKACGTARPMIEAICVRASSLQLAEQDLGLRRRSGKTLLIKGLTALAAHYRIG